MYISYKKKTASRLLKYDIFSKITFFRLEALKNNYINNLLSAFTKIEEKRETKQSPLRQQINWEEEMAFNKDKENFDRKMALANYNLAAKDSQREDAKFSAEYEFDVSTGRYKKIDKIKSKVSPLEPSPIQSTDPGDAINAVTSYEEGTQNLKSQAYQTAIDLILGAFVLVSKVVITLEGIG